MTRFSWCYAICVLLFTVSVESQRWQIQTGNNQPYTARPPYVIIRDKNTQSKLDDVNSANSGFLKLTRDKEISLLRDGTKWCSGDGKPQSYIDFGRYKNTDKCCRNYSYCKYRIEPNGELFGIKNIGPLDINYCECIKQFEACLTNTNSKVSQVLYKIFTEDPKFLCLDYVHPFKCLDTSPTGTCVYDIDLSPKWTVVGAKKNYIFPAEN